MEHAHVAAAQLAVAAVANSQDATAPVAKAGAYDSLSCKKLQALPVEERKALNILSAAPKNAATGDAVELFLIRMPRSPLTEHVKDARLPPEKAKFRRSKQGCRLAADSDKPFGGSCSSRFSSIMINLALGMPHSLMIANQSFPAIGNPIVSVAHSGASKEPLSPERAATQALDPFAATERLLALIANSIRATKMSAMLAVRTATCASLWKLADRKANFPDSQSSSATKY